MTANGVPGDMTHVQQLVVEDNEREKELRLSPKNLEEHVMVQILWTRRVTLITAQVRVNFCSFETRDNYIIFW